MLFFHESGSTKGHSSLLCSRNDISNCANTRKSNNQQVHDIALSWRIQNRVETIFEKPMIPFSNELIYQPLSQITKQNIFNAYKFCGSVCTKVQQNFSFVSVCRMNHASSISWPQNQHNLQILQEQTLV